ncbi:hypothetical protein D6774_01870 [Candidatus Woesearchaeota archaeon]|nr:MAG: hypothetical protein D6774_01870 [Candidatus Woesearchaeota archaeon]
MLIKKNLFDVSQFNKILIAYKKVMNVHERVDPQEALDELFSSGRFVFSQGGENWITRLVFEVKEEFVDVRFETARRYQVGRFAQVMEKNKEAFEEELKKRVSVDQSNKA